jgi:hypothetical protein
VTMEKLTVEQRKEIEDELMEQSHRIVFGRRGKRAVNPRHENARIMKR